MTKHYKFSPSSAKRWLACPGSLNHEGDNRETSYAAEGTRAHSLAANLLGFRLGQCDGYALSQSCDWPGEMSAAAQIFADYCAPIAELADCYAIEQTMESPVDPERGGTADFWAKLGDVCTVVDFKYGAGLPVAAERNEQLLSYALLLVERFPELQTFHLVIVQPRTAGDAIDVWSCDRAEVDAFAARVSAAAAQSHYAPGEHCRFCPVIASCEHLHKRALELAGEDFAIEAAADRWPELMRLWPSLQKMFDVIPGRMLDAMRKGKTFPGFKAVRAIGNRTWAQDEAATLKALARRKIGKRQACESRLRSPTQLEKAGFGPALDGLVERPDRGLALVPASDKRQAVSFETANESFAELAT
jgi:hypothetical protein